ncbi:Panacea domain-containing protein [Leifsonia sp. P73]|uniref:Panacea domain-containing protein n=1 Tax=Leifsonia sp. P73 TaxID=3423959 RepID=UPI003DA590F2
MASVLDVAAYVLQKSGPITAMKLQKLVYYAQSWHAVWTDSRLFPEDFEAWANGPVSPVLYKKHRGRFTVDDTLEGLGDASALTADEAESVDAVLSYYGTMRAAQLIELTHREQPWMDARGDLLPGDRGFETIPFAAMAEYYGSLHAGASAEEG